MSAADKIAEARALIEPLTGYSPGPWEVVTDLPAIAIAAGNHRVVQTPNQNNYRHFGRSEPWLGIGSFSNAALIAAAPALRDTVAALADLADAQAQEIERLRKVIGFYANPENWKGDEEAWERAENGDDDPETLEAMLSTVEIDGGKIARATLGDAP